MVQDLLTDPDIEIALHQTSAAHAVFHYRFASAQPERATHSGFEQGIYDRGDVTFLLDDLALPLHTAYGLPEFDTLSFETELLIRAFQDLGDSQPRRIVAFNPRQGHLPVILWRRLRPQVVDLVDRDLLSLRYSRLNLALNGCPEETVGLYHQTDLVPTNGSPDLVLGVLREEEGPDVIEKSLVQAATRLHSGALILIAGGSTPVTRVLKSREIDHYLRTGKRRRSKGNSTALLQRP